jgi:hypothetical protein
MPETRRLQRRPRAAEEYEEGEEEERPRLRRNQEERPQRHSGADDDSDLTVGPVAVGWGGYHRTKANAPTKWATLYKVPDEEQLIMFLQDGPYASFNMHWCEWMPRGQKQSYVCMRPEECPLCEIDDPSSRIRFNILDLHGDEPILTTYECGITVAETIAKYQPIEHQYFAICMFGPKKQRRTQIRPVKARDLIEDWDTKPLTDEQIHSFDRKLWDASAVDRSTRAQLQEIADAATQ